MDSTHKKWYCIFLLILFAFFIIGCKGAKAPKNETQDNRTPVVKTHKITVTTPELPDATMDKPYTFDFSEGMDPKGGVPPYIYELGTAKGFPPMGLILSPSGLLRGTPSVKDEVKFDVCARDIGGDYACTTVFLNVKIADEPEVDYFLYEGNWSGVFSYLYREGHEQQNKQTHDWEMIWTEWKPAEMGVMVTLEPTLPEYSFEENLLRAKMNNFWMMNITKAAITDPGFGTGNGVYMGDSKPFPSVANLPYNSTPYSMNPMVAAYLSKEQLEVATMAMKRALGFNMYFPGGSQLMTYPGVLQVSEDGLTLSNSDEQRYANETWVPYNVSSGLLYYYHRWTTPPGEIVNYTVEFRFTGWELKKGYAPKTDLTGLWEGKYTFHWEYDDSNEKNPVNPVGKCVVDTTASIKVCVKQDGESVSGIFKFANFNDVIGKDVNTATCTPKTIQTHCDTITNDNIDKCGSMDAQLDDGKLNVNFLKIDYEDYNNIPNAAVDMAVFGRVKGNLMTVEFAREGYNMVMNGDFRTTKISDKCPT